MQRAFPRTCALSTDHLANRSLSTWSGDICHEASLCRNHRVYFRRRWEVGLADEEVWVPGRPSLTETSAANRDEHSQVNTCCSQVLFAIQNPAELADIRHVQVKTPYHFASQIICFVLTRGSHRTGAFLLYWSRRQFKWRGMRSQWHVSSPALAPILSSGSVSGAQVHAKPCPFQHGSRKNSSVQLEYELCGSQCVCASTNAIFPRPSFGISTWVLRRKPNPGSTQNLRLVRENLRHWGNLISGADPGDQQLCYFSRAQGPTPEAEKQMRRFVVEWVSQGTQRSFPRKRGRFWWNHLHLWWGFPQFELGGAGTPGFLLDLFLLTPEAPRVSASSSETADKRKSHLQSALHLLTLIQEVQLFAASTGRTGCGECLMEHASDWRRTDAVCFKMCRFRGFWVDFHWTGLDLSGFGKRWKFSNAERVIPVVPTATRFHLYWTFFKGELVSQTRPWTCLGGLKMCPQHCLRPQPWSSSTRGTVSQQLFLLSRRHSNACVKFYSQHNRLIHGGLDLPQEGAILAYFESFFSNEEKGNVFHLWRQFCGAHNLPPNLPQIELTFVWETHPSLFRRSPFARSVTQVIVFDVAQRDCRIFARIESFRCNTSDGVLEVRAVVRPVGPHWTYDVNVWRVCSCDASHRTWGTPCGNAWVADWKLLHCGHCFVFLLKNVSFTIYWAEYWSGNHAE